MIVLLLCISLTSRSYCKQIRLYQVGNSHTFDSRTSRTGAFPEIVSTQGHELVLGQHIRCGGSLAWMATHPDDTCEITGDFGTYDIALSNYEWDVVAFQPFNQSVQGIFNTFDEELDAMLQIASLIQNKNTRILLYTTWADCETFRQDIKPRKYRDVWEKPFTSSDLSVTRTREFFYSWCHQAKRELHKMGFTQIDIVPCGDLIAQLEAKIQERGIPSYPSVDYFYRDYLHMSIGGSYAIGLLLYCILYDEEDATKLPLPEHYNINPEAALIIRSVVNDVLRTCPQDSASIPWLLSITSQSIDWRTHFGFSYVLQASTDGSSWISRDTLPGDGNKLQVEATGGILYRIIRE